MPEPLPAVIVAGASAGGVQALGRLVGDLPEDFAAPVLVVLHLHPEATSMLADILSRSGRLTATTARDCEPLHAAHIYVAPPDHHLVVEHGLVRLNRGPRVNGHRPALDPTMRSVGDEYGRRAVGVVLSGNGDDGSAGLAWIKRGGGRTLVQDPDECQYKGMPRSALERVEVDDILPVARMAQRLIEIAGAGPPSEAPSSGLEGFGGVVARLDPSSELGKSHA